MSSPTTSAVIRDVNQVPSPQFWDNINGNYAAVYGHDGALYTISPPIADGTSAAPTVYSSAALENSGVLKNSSGVIYKLFVTCTLTTGGPFYIMLFNTVSVPSTGVVCAWRQPIGVGTSSAAVNAVFDFTMYGKAFSTGISYAISSTPSTYTSVSNNDYLVEALMA